MVAIVWPGMSAALRDARGAWQALAEQVSGLMLEALSSSQSLLPIALTALSDRGVRAASASLQSALWRAVQPSLLGFTIAAAVYWIAFERSPWQATPGKRALGLQVTDIDGLRVGWPRASARHFAGTLSWLTLNLGHLLAAVPPHRRALHDFVAGTRVAQHHARGRLPMWAIAWLALQAIASIVLATWWLQMLQDALGRSLENF